MTKLYLFIEEMIAHTENKKHTKELLELINKSNNIIEYEFNIQKSIIFLNIIKN